MKIIHHSKTFVIISVIVVLISLGIFLGVGLRLGIDFTGGSLLEISVNEINKEQLTEAIEKQEISVSQIQETGDGNALIRMQEINEEKHQSILASLKESNDSIEEVRFESIGPTIGNELRQKAFVAIGLVLLAIVAYLAYAFRKVSSDVKSWKFGLCAIGALIHDIAIIIAAFSLFGYFWHVEVDVLFVTALLTVLGFSVHDTIVVFDRIRYNLTKAKEKAFVDTVNKSVSQTIVRSLNTSTTTLIVLLALYLFGGATLQWFIVALMIGVVAGTYSSIFVASPLLVWWQSRGN